MRELSTGMIMVRFCARHFISFLVADFVAIGWGLTTANGNEPELVLLTPFFWLCGYVLTLLALRYTILKTHSGWKKEQDKIAGKAKVDALVKARMAEKAGNVPS